MNSIIIDAPPSKSISHRLLMAAALAGGESRLSNILESKDTERTMAVLAAAGADIRRAMETMRTAQVRRLPVTEGGKLAGILSIDDIARSGKWDMECAQALCGITANVCRR